MNRARVAALLRELADEVERDEDVPEPKKSEPRRRRARKPRLPVVPANTNVSDTDRAAARAHLRRTGNFIEVKR